ncbi:UDP-glycosyltransferase 75C1 [Hordeum vulgare]|nr:UDP-glycosyltransferase 75C1 [Hordeum vulgare]
MEWLDSKPAGSVVYVSFGSMSTVSKRQKDELKRGLAASGRAYLWVVRNNNRDDVFDVAGDVRGMVVGWCDQVRVLRIRPSGASSPTAAGTPRWRPWRAARRSSPCRSGPTRTPTRAWSSSGASDASVATHGLFC